MHVASIATRSGGTWVDTGITWKCRLQPVSPTDKIEAEQFVHSTHMAVGEPTPVIVNGTQLTIASVNYYVVGIQMQDRPGVGHHHQEVWLAKAEV